MRAGVLVKIGDTVISKIECQRYTVMKLIGQGGQGSVFLLEHPNRGKKVLKWYTPEQATEQQYDVILRAIRIGKPAAGKHITFIWPQDIVETDSGFGYIMELIDSRFIGYGNMIRDISLAPSLKMRCAISRHLVQAYQLLHLSGYCYRDISDGNFLFDPQSGDVVICDNDNVGVEGIDISQVLGTLEFMAPEVVLGKARPGVGSDLYSLAVLLFKFLVWHHPYHGLLEYMVKSWDLFAKRWLYAETPIFIFNPKDRRNRLPDVEGYRDVHKMWELLPESLRRTFILAFTTGIYDVTQRPREHDWIAAIADAEDSLIRCAYDGAENFYGRDHTCCWFCKKPLDAPDVLIVTSPYGVRDILLYSGGTLTAGQLDSVGGSLDEDTVIGVVVGEKGSLSLSNCGSTVWKCGISQIECGGAVPLRDGLEIEFSEAVKGTFRIGGLI